jgi:hypothetical protein
MKYLSFLQNKKLLKLLLLLLLTSAFVPISIFTFASQILLIVGELHDNTMAKGVHTFISDVDISPIGFNMHDATMNWKEYTNMQYNYHLRYPPLWTVRQDNPNSISIIDPATKMRFATIVLSMDCNSMRSKITQQTNFNYFLTKEYQKQVSGRNGSAYEFLDTIDGIRETHILVTEGDTCYDLILQRSAGPDSKHQDTILEMILSSFELLAKQ